MKREIKPTSRAAKVRHVKRQRQTRPHTCHWPGCTKQVPPALWGCKRHWLTLPAELRERIWATYRPGQERDLRPSRAYLAAAEAVQAWIIQTGRSPRPLLREEHGRD